jgi:ArsR family transcriptional regulator
MAPGLTDSAFHRIAKALADPNRFRILQRLSGSPEALHCQLLLSEMGVAPATMSHHLKELATAGLIDTRKDGQHLLAEANHQMIARYERELSRRLKATG